MAFGKHWGPLEVFPFAVAEGSDGQGKADPKIHRFHVNRNGPPPTPNTKNPMKTVSDSPAISSSLPSVQSSSS